MTKRLLWGEKQQQDVWRQKEGEAAGAEAAETGSSEREQQQ